MIKIKIKSLDKNKRPQTVVGIKRALPTRTN